MMSRFLGARGDPASRNRRITFGNDTGTNARDTYLSA
jgi:hypothetical protein